MRRWLIVLAAIAAALAVVGVLYLENRGPSDAAGPDAVARKMEGSKPPRVSLAAACHLLWNGVGANTNPFVSSVELLSREHWSMDDLRKAQKDVDELQEIADRAPPALERQLRTVIKETRSVIHDAATGDTGEWDTTDWKAAGYDIADQCRPYAD